MNKIAHRGNVLGKSNMENEPSYILNASLNYFVEVDVWFDEGSFFLGHDEPQYPIGVEFLKNEKFFCHAKNVEALHEMLKNNIHCFWHENDKVTLTSKGYVWKYPEVYYNGSLWGVCSDRL